MTTHARELELITNEAVAADQADASTGTGSQPRQGTARVHAELPAGAGVGPSWVLREGALELRARQAASCLLRPEVGDQVWFVAAGEARHIIAVLDRANPDAVAELGVDGDANLRVGGQLRVEAQTTLELRGQTQLALRSGEEIQVQAPRARVFLDECAAVFKTLLTHASRSTVVAKLIETFSERVSSSAKTSLRSVSELDQVQAGVLDHRGREAVHLAGDKVLINGGEIAKVEAGQIHLG